jgi:hypothetical protein
MEFFDKIANLIKPEDKEEVFHLFDPNGRMTPATTINLSQVREGVNPLIFLHPAANEEPYCDKAEGRWQSILNETNKYASDCKIYDDIEVRVRDVNSGKQAVAATKARVVSKAKVPIQQNEKSGLVYLDNNFYIVSPIFLDEQDKKFVLVARPGLFSEEVGKQLVDIFFALPDGHI